MAADRFVEYTYGTSGMDKLLKTMAYGLGILGNSMQTGGTKNRTSIGLQQLASQITMSRYPLRFFGFVECIVMPQGDGFAVSYAYL